MKLCPNCSEWIGRFIGVDYETTKEDDGYDNQDSEVSISTDSFPNGALSSALHCLREGYGLNDVEWDNNGGGAHWDTLETSFKVGQSLLELEKTEDITFDSEEIDLIDALTQGAENSDSDVKRQVEEFVNKVEARSLEKVIPILIVHNKKMVKELLNNNEIPKDLKHKIKTIAVIEAI